MVGDPVQPTKPHISRVDGVAWPVTWYGIGDELDLDVVVFEGVVELVGLAYWDAFFVDYAPIFEHLEARHDVTPGPSLVSLMTALWKAFPCDKLPR